MHDPTPDPPKPEQRAPGRAWLGAALVALAAFVVLGHDLPAEPHFADESAYISQSYYADLWLRGQWNHVEWLTYPAFDLPPVPKYLIGAALMTCGHRRPGPEQARQWYEDINRRCETDAMLAAARWPMVVLGAVGCVAVFAIGTLAAGLRTGGLAALLLMANPLYRMLARRAMSDVPTEAFLLASAAAFLWGWQRCLARGTCRPPWLAAGGAGACAGLAVLSKLSGVLALMVIGAWAVLAMALPRAARGAKLAIAVGAVLTGLVAGGVFVALNPYMTAQPDVSRLGAHPVARLASLGAWGRARHMLAVRLAVSSEQQKIFSSYALRSLPARLEAVAVQGFGRFGPLGPAHSDSTQRFDWSQDRGALIWLPWVALGGVWACVRGGRQLRAGEPPTGWALLVQAVVTAATVTAFIPLAWDRYYLSLQPVAALLAAGVTVAACDAVIDRVRRRREG